MKSRTSLTIAALLLIGGSWPVGAQSLIPLRLKEMARPDRIPEEVQDSTSLSKAPVQTQLPANLPNQRWPGETFALLAQAQLTKLAAGDVREVLAKGFQSSDLEAPISPKKGAVQQGNGGALKQRTVQEFAEQLRELGKLKIKIIDNRKFTTQLHVEADRTVPQRAEYSATWQCTWNAETPPRLTKVAVEHFKTISSTETKPWMADQTTSVIGHNPRFAPQVLRGMEFWTQRITRIGDLAMTGHHGIAVGDVNGDGLEDLYVCDGGSLPNQLYLQQPDGTANEVAADWGVAWLEDSRGALLIDLDNDGDQDLVVATIAMIAFAENNGAGKFELRGGFPGAPYPFSLSAADFDSDGDLDLYTCLYSAGDAVGAGRRGFEANSPAPFDDAKNGGRNILLANLGQFRFTDVTRQVGLDQDNTRWSFAAAWEDIDRDGDPDLYVANDFGRNCLYRNDKGRFTNIAKEAGVEDIGAGMSVSWGDPNRDGSADLLVGNMFSSAGRRVASQQGFDKNLTRMARGNSLFTATGKTFQDQSISAGLTNGGWAWSSALADLDNDGWQDIIVANGYLTNTRDNDL